METNKRKREDENESNKKSKIYNDINKNTNINTTNNIIIKKKTRNFLKLFINTETNELIKKIKEISDVIIDEDFYTTKSQWINKLRNLNQQIESLHELYYEK